MMNYEEKIYIVVDRYPGDYRSQLIEKITQEFGDKVVFIKEEDYINAQPSQID